MKQILKIFLIILGMAIALLVVYLSALNVANFAKHREYYSVEERICANPGLFDGFICQGIAASEENQVILVSGYMNDGSNSRIYVTDFQSNSYYVELTKLGKDYKGHAGGIAIYNDTIYISNASKLLLLSLSDVLCAKNGETVNISSEVKVNSAASFVFANDEFVFVGEFNDPSAEQKKHAYDTPNGVNHAIIEVYRHTDLENPVKIYSIGDYVQGVCFTPGGQIVFSTSHGKASSVFYIYDEKEAFDSGNTLDGAKIYYLGSCQRKILGPAMSEGLDWFDGKVITLFESASDKYLFGRFFFAFNIVGLDLED